MLLYIHTYIHTRCFTRYSSNMAAETTPGSSLATHYDFWHAVSHYGAFSQHLGPFPAFDKHFRFSNSTFGSTSRPHVARPTTAYYKD